jgi:hypothetical protein
MCEVLEVITDAPCAVHVINTTFAPDSHIYAGIRSVPAAAKSTVMSCAVNIRNTTVRNSIRRLMYATAAKREGPVLTGKECTLPIRLMPFPKKCVQNQEPV